VVQAVGGGRWVMLRWCVPAKHATDREDVLGGVGGMVDRQYNVIILYWNDNDGEKSVPVGSRGGGVRSIGFWGLAVASGWRE
jgi:hypothetical protein